MHLSAVADQDHVGVEFADVVVKEVADYEPNKVRSILQSIPALVRKQIVKLLLQVFETDGENEDVLVLLGLLLALIHHLYRLEISLRVEPQFKLFPYVSLFFAFHHVFMALVSLLVTYLLDDVDILDHIELL